MNAQDFVNAMGKSCPDATALANNGYSKEEIDNRVRSFIFKRKEVANPNRQFHSEIEKLLSLWDVSGLEIGMITFYKDTRDHSSGGFAFGDFEADPLVIKENALIVVEELHHSGHVLCQCAIDSSSFLDAVSHYADFYSKRMAGIVDYDDSDTLTQVINECARHAGGSQFRNFYSILGGEE